ncbi:MAG: hypothetical protein NZ516_09905 [Raineya sp.]|nr:hypothetical protein [Raineya sp.]
MKKYIIFSLLLNACWVKAQIPTTNFTVNGQHFIVEELPNILVVENAQSPIKSGAVVPNGIPNRDCYLALIGFATNPFYNFNYRKEDFIRYTNILREVFPYTRAMALGMKKSINMYFTINPQGQILEIRYQFGKDLAITPNELELLDRRLKESMFFTFKPNHVCSSSNVISLQVIWVTFEELYSPYGYGLGEDWMEFDRQLRELIEEGEDPRN